MIDAVQALFRPGIVTALTLAFALLAPHAAASPQSRGDGFRLLTLSGYHVKWGAPALGTGATVSYAFIREPMEFGEARNCSRMVPTDDLSARSGVAEDVLHHEAAAAFRVWESAANIRFVVADDPADADILIGAQRTPIRSAFANVEYRPESTTGVQVIDQALICLNPDHPWKVGFNGDVGSYDIRYTLIHEIGHAIGLDHAGPSGQMMSFRYTEAFRELQPGDLRGITALYGRAPEFPEPLDVPREEPAESVVSNLAPPLSPPLTLMPRTEGAR